MSRNVLVFFGTVVGGTLIILAMILFALFSFGKSESAQVVGGFITVRSGYIGEAGVWWGSDTSGFPTDPVRSIDISLRSGSSFSLPEELIYRLSHIRPSTGVVTHGSAGLKVVLRGGDGAGSYQVVFEQLGSLWHRSITANYRHDDLLPELTVVAQN